MKALGLLLLVSGFAIVLAAVLLLRVGVPRGAFLAAGIAVQLLGLFLAFRAHYTLDEEH